MAWVWRGDNFGPHVYNIQRSTPIYADGKLFSVAGERRTVIAMDPATGETLWTFREPSPMLTPGLVADAEDPNPIGRTVAEFVAGPGGVRGPQGLPLFKPPYARITAIDLNTGETLWWIPNGDTPDRIKNHPALEGVDIGNTGSPSHPTTISTKSLLIYGEGRGGRAVLHAHNKTTGERIGTVEIPAPTNTAPMTFMHEGVQYIVAPIGGRSGGRGGRGGAQLAGSFVALRLPE